MSNLYCTQSVACSHPRGDRRRPSETKLVAIAHDTLPRLGTSTSDNSFLSPITKTELVAYLIKDNADTLESSIKAMTTTRSARILLASATRKTFYRAPGQDRRGRRVAAVSRVLTAQCRCQRWYRRLTRGHGSFCLSWCTIISTCPMKFTLQIHGTSAR